MDAVCQEPIERLGRTKEALPHELQVCTVPVPVGGWVIVKSLHGNILSDYLPVDSTPTGTVPVPMWPHHMAVSGLLPAVRSVTL